MSTQEYIHGLIELFRSEEKHQILLERMRKRYRQIFGDMTINQFNYQEVMGTMVRTKEDETVMINEVGRLMGYSR